MHIVPGTADLLASFVRTCHVTHTGTSSLISLIRTCFFDDANKTYFNLFIVGIN